MLVILRLNIDLHYVALNKNPIVVNCSFFFSIMLDMKVVNNYYLPTMVRYQMFKMI